MELSITPQQIDEQRVLVAEFETGVGGWISAVAHPRGWEINHLWVDPDFLKQGIGDRLLHSCLATLGAPTRVMVTSDPNARGFYERHGFVHRDWEDAWPPGRRLPVLELHIPDQ